MAIPGSRLGKGFVLAAVVTATLVAGSSPALATTGWGFHGQAWATGVVNCWANLYPGTTTAFVPAPTVYAWDAHAGLGNDWNWVRYRYLFTDMTGAVFSTTGWSGWGMAYDNSSPFRGAPSYSFNRGSFRVQAQIEWWNATVAIGGATLTYGNYTATNYFGIVNGTAAGGC